MSIMEAQLCCSVADAHVDPDANAAASATVDPDATATADAMLCHTR